MARKKSKTAPRAKPKRGLGPQADRALRRAVRRRGEETETFAGFEKPRELPTSHYRMELPGESRATLRPGRVRTTKPDPLRAPKQRRLTPVQRGITRQAMKLSKGKPLTDLRRRQMRPVLTQELYEAICADRKARREVMFAKRQTNKGAAAKTRQRSIFSDIRC